MVYVELSNFANTAQLTQIYMVYVAPNNYSTNLKTYLQYATQQSLVRRGGKLCKKVAGKLDVFVLTF